MPYNAVEVGWREGGDVKIQSLVHQSALLRVLGIQIVRLGVFLVQIAQDGSAARGSPCISSFNPSEVNELRCLPFPEAESFVIHRWDRVLWIHLFGKK